MKTRFAWLSHVAWGAIDQGIVSAANFAVGISLARVFDQEAYGAFGVAFGVYMFVLGLHSAMVQEPLSVDMPSVEDRESFFGAQHVLSFMFVVVASGATALLWGAVVAAGLPLLARVGVGLLIAQPLLLTQQHLRRLLYTLDDARGAAISGMSYGVVSIGTLAVVAWGGVTDAAWLFAPMAGGAFGAIAVSGALLRSKARATLPSRGRLLGVLGDNLTYGKWAGASSVVYWCSTYSYWPLLGVVGGLAEAGAARAMANLTMPLNLLVTSFGMSMLPGLARRSQREGDASAARSMWRIAAGMGVLGLLYFAVIAVAGGSLVQVAYDSAFYSEYVGLLVLLTGAQAMAAYRQGIYTGLRARRMPRLLLYGQGAGAVVTMTLGVYLVAVMGANGMGIAQLVSTGAEVAVLVGFALTASNAPRAHVDGSAHGSPDEMRA